MTIRKDDLIIVRHSPDDLIDSRGENTEAMYHKSGQAYLPMSPKYRFILHTQRYNKKYMR